MRTAPPPLVLLLLVHWLATAASARFTCSATGAAATCRSLVGYLPAKATTYSGIASLFQVTPLEVLFGVNGLPTSTSADGPVAAGSTVRVPVPCRCANGTGWSDGTPVYKVKDGDGGLYNITVAWFSNLTTYEDIGVVNNLPDVDNITIGQELWIPLPCSCDEVGGKQVVHLAHLVAPGSSVEGIAEEFGTNASTLLELNGISDPKLLDANKPLDVPLTACSSSITNESLNYDLRLANGSYVITANGCITCSCSATTYKLDCRQSNSQGSSQCIVGTCQGSLSIGNITTSGCEVRTCSYAGYTNTSTTVTTVMANITTDRTNCNDGGGGLGSRGFEWSTAVLVFLHMLWLSFQ